MMYYDPYHGLTSYRCYPTAKFYYGFSLADGDAADQSRNVIDSRLAVTDVKRELC